MTGRHLRGRRGRFPGRMLPIVAAAVSVAALGVGVWWAGGSQRAGVGRAAPPVQTVSRVRALSPRSLCLLTDSGGVLRGPGAAVWAGIQSVGEAQQVRVRFVQVPDARLAGSLVNSLVAQRCSVIVAVGGAQVAAVDNAATGPRPGVRFAVAGGPGRAGVVSFPATADGARQAVGRLSSDAGGGS